MSGIVGIINLDGAPVDRDLLTRMTKFMSYRGPDAQEIWIDGNVAFGHTMLRTTWEAETEIQPLTLDGKVRLTADARIDGRKELIAELETKFGAKLRVPQGANCNNSESRIPNDAELILFAYQAWERDCVKHLIGDFSFAIWDGPERMLFCARDHFGVKPFYYASLGGVFIFSNTLNCLRLHPGVSNELNEVAIGDFLLTASNRDLTSTIFADVKRLPPANRISLATIAERDSYWTLSQETDLRYRRSGDYVDHFNELFNSAVADRIRSAKVGISMSGGLDSAAVAAITCRQRLGKTELGVEAFTMVYDWLIPDEERYYSGLVAEHLGIPINYLAVDNYSLYERWDQPFLAYPEPMYFPLSAISFDLFNRISNYGRVMLSGDGGDLALLPSVKYLSQQLRSFRWWHIFKSFLKHVGTYRRVPALGFRTAFRSGRGKPVAQTTYPIWLAPSFKRRLELSGRFERNDLTGSGSRTRPEAYGGLMSSAWSNIFEQEDPGFTSVIVEKRNPFFDARLIEYLFSIPAIPWFVEKEILRLAMTGILPEEIRRRPKSPLQGSALSKLWRGGWRQYFDPIPRLSAYVDLDVFVGSTSEGDIDHRWHDYLPIGLNYWLRNLEGNQYNAES
ncbi:MAG: hypothetical protein QOG23_3496 [Blastocatellia bacterium]|jgi:asparagine synthase (glutamine-hydrolysing)|nr:hypothetical protein [Blastocatellia bacterium]